MSSAKVKYELKAYPLDGGYIATVKVDGDAGDAIPQQSEPPQTVIVLDRSGSMGDNVRKMVNEVLPLFFNELSYDQFSMITLITFDDKVELVKCSVGQLKTLALTSRGCTYMTGAVNQLKKVFKSLDKNKPMRILTVSDGDVFDQVNVAEAGAQLANLTARYHTPINSQAVRLFTSSSSPDTTALCSLLQINNTAPSQLLDILASTPSKEIASQMAKLFNPGEYSHFLTLTASDAIFLKFPWDQKAHEKLSVMTDQSVFWMKELPSGGLKVGGGDETIKITLNDEVDASMTLDRFHRMIAPQLDYIFDHMKILKVIGTAEAADTVKQIFEYFNRMEEILPTVEEKFDANSTHIRSRIKQMVFKRKKRISLLLSTIANDDKISLLNSAQKADYLRKVHNTQSSRGLARRATKEGLNFDEIARYEVQEMAKHFDEEIKDIDDQHHSISFFSQDTTLGGIKALVEVSNESAFESFTAVEILESLNVVGVACSGPIGDYPDPMTWRLDEIFLGCNVSVSDILVAYNQSGGSSLVVPAIDKEITNVIPVFDDERIGAFLKRHAPSLLEYTFSLGMRRLICQVPMTIGYTICAGIWKMIFELNTNRSTLHLEVFEKFVSTFNGFVGKYFDHINPLLMKPGDKKLSMFIGNNGISNMMCPLIRIYKRGNADELKLVPSIMRALYSHEVWRGIRRAYKNRENSDEIAKNMIFKLLGIDLSKHQTHALAPFKKEPNLSEIKFHDAFDINHEYLEELFKPVLFTNYLALVPSYLQALFKGPLESLKDIPPLSNASMIEAFAVKDVPTFQFHSAFQALRYRTLESRMDSALEKSKIVDVADETEAFNEVKDYVRSLYEAQYLSELAEKKKIEIDNMGKFVAKKILTAKTYQKMVACWREGIAHNELTYKIETPSSAGFKIFYAKLCDPSATIPLRSSIFKILILGVDEDKNSVWNHGGVYFPNKSLKEAFLQSCTLTDWEAIIAEFGSTGRHKYRATDPNRHSHSNSKPSYWAMGFSSLHEFRCAIAEEDFLDYCKEHQACCGVRHLDQNFLKKINIVKKS